MNLLKVKVIGSEKELNLLMMKSDMKSLNYSLVTSNFSQALRMTQLSPGASKYC